MRLLRAIVQRLQAAKPRSVLLAGWVFLLVYAYPGQMTTDSFDHLAESRAGFYTDGHPPMTSAIWHVLETTIAGSFGMLLLQSGVFLWSLYAILRRFTRPCRAAWIATLTFVFPPVLLPFAVIWKDCMMAAFLMLGIAGLLDERRWVKLAALGALLIATAVRYNAFAATFPCVVLLFEWRAGMHWLKRYAISFVAWLAVTFSAFTVDGALVDKQMHFWHSSLAIYDIVGTLRYTDDTIPDAELERIFEGTDLLVHRDIHQAARDVFFSRDFLPIITAKGRLWNLPAYGYELVPEPRRDAIERAWREIVLGHKGAYLKYRTAVMLEVLSFTRFKPAGVVPHRELKVNEFAYAQHHPIRWSPLQGALTHVMSEIWMYVPMFLPWIYLLLGLVLVIRWRQRLVLALVGSGIAIEASLFFLAPAPDYRYSHWLVVASCVAAAVVVSRQESRIPGARRQPWLRDAANSQHSAAEQASPQ